MFQQIMQQLTQGQGQSSAPDTFDLTTEPTAPEGGTLVIRDSLALGPINSTPGSADDGPTEEITFVFGKLETVYFHAVDPTNPDAGSSGHTGGVNFVMCDGSVRSDEGPEENDFSADVNGDAVTGTVTFGGSITLQNVREVDTLNDWFQI
jgi:prepilin-type processing-associated H-X9-DG protein